MRLVLLGLSAAALAFPAAAPAAAQSLAGAGFTAGAAMSTDAGMSGVTVHHGDGDHSDRGHHRGDGGFGGYYPGLRESYDINRSWAPDSYNDWWHERPERAFPRWMSANQDCQRQYWSGGGWRC